MTFAEGDPSSEDVSSAARSVCPDCGTVVEPFQEYCLVCGARLGATGGGGLAGRWRHALPFTDRDWGWPVLIALAVAAVATVFSILAVRGEKSTTLQALGPTIRQTTASVTTATSSAATTASTGGTTAATTANGTATTSTSPINTGGGLIAWPGQPAYTIVLASLPVSSGKTAARQKALQALHAGLGPDVGVLSSSDYSSLHPGYYVIFSGVYKSQAEALRHRAAAERAGFNSPYVKRVSS